MYMSLKVLEALDVLRNAAENDFERHRLDILINDLTAPPTVETIDDTHQKFCGVTYTKHKNREHYDRRVAIHRAVWFYQHGEIPNEYKIHHIDENPANNHISNLQMLTNAEHKKIHNQISNPKEYICKNCGKIFKSKCTTALFCSQKCFQTWHRNDYEKTCPICKKIFKTNHKQTICCSKECSYKMISIKLSSPLHKKTCPVCGKIFTSKDSRKKCCSQSCGSKLGWQKNEHKKIKSKVCPICGNTFLPQDNRKICCSHSCAAKLRWQKKITK